MLSFLCARLLLVLCSVPLLSNSVYLKKRVPNRFCFGRFGNVCSIQRILTLIMVVAILGQDSSLRCDTFSISHPGFLPTPVVKDYSDQEHFKL